MSKLKIVPKPFQFQLTYASRFNRCWKLFVLLLFTEQVNDVKTENGMYFKNRTKILNYDQLSTNHYRVSQLCDLFGTESIL